MKDFEKLRNIPLGVVADTCKVQSDCENCPFHSDRPLVYDSTRNAFIYCLPTAVIDNPSEDIDVFLDEDVKITVYHDVVYTVSEPDFETMTLEQIIAYCNIRKDCNGCPFNKNYGYYKPHKNSQAFKVECKLSLLRWEERYSDTLEKVGE